MAIELGFITLKSSVAYYVFYLFVYNILMLLFCSIYDLQGGKQLKYLLKIKNNIIRTI